MSFRAVTYRTGLCLSHSFFVLLARNQCRHLFHAILNHLK
jgi:hypothetical protein